MQISFLRGKKKKKKPLSIHSSVCLIKKSCNQETADLPHAISVISHSNNKIFKQKTKSKLNRKLK